MEVSDHTAELLGPYVLVRVEALGAKQLHQAHFSRLAPVRAVGRPRDVGIVVGGVLSGGGLRPGCEDEVVGLEEELGGGDGGAHDDGEGPEAELHDGPVLEREVVDGAVRERADEVKVANDGPRPWARR